MTSRWGSNEVSFLPKSSLKSSRNQWIMRKTSAQNQIAIWKKNFKHAHHAELEINVPQMKLMKNVDVAESVGSLQITVNKIL